MKNTICTSIVAILLFSLQAWSGTWEETLALQTPEAKAQAFLKVRAMIPSIADGAVRYEFDPLALLNSQLVIESLVQNDALYQELKKNHTELLEFKVFDAAAMDADQAKKIANWQAAMTQAEQFAKSAGIYSQQALLNEMQKILASPYLGKSQGIVTGLAQLLPAPLKKEFFALPVDKKVAVLQQHLPAEVVSQGFAANRLGWSDLEISKQEIISRLQQAVAAEQDLTKILIAHYAQQGGGEAKDYLQKLPQDLQNRKTLEQLFASNIAKQIPTDKSSAVSAEPALVMREASPIIAMFRGFAGNDCSTYCSFPFVHSPNEYTFIVYDNKGSVKGYIQGTKVFVDTKAVFYLHTIAGPRISSKDTFRIIKTLLQETKAIGFTDVLLPAMDKIDGLVNFMPIRDAIKQVYVDSPKALNYADSPLREKFKSTFQLYKNYDDAAANLFGYQIDREKLNFNIHVQRGLAPGLESLDARVDKNALVGMLMQMGKSYQKNKAMIEAIAQQEGISASQISQLIFQAKNVGRLPSRAFAASMQKAMTDAGFDFKEGYFENNISLIALGLLQSPDVKDNPILAEKVLFSLLDQREIIPVHDFLQTNPKVLARTSLVQAFLGALYGDVHEADLKDSPILAEVLKRHPQTVLKDASVLAFLVQAPKAKAILDNYLLENPAWTQVLPPSVKDVVLQARTAQDYLLNRYLRLLQAAKTDAEYDERIRELTTEANNLKLGQVLMNKLKADLYALTIDQYLKYPTQVSRATIFHYLATNMRRDQSIARAVRKMLPEILKTINPYQLTQHLEYAASAKRLAGGNSQALDQRIEEALLSRADRATISNRMAVELFPGVRWERMKAPSCEGIFL